MAGDGKRWLWRRWRGGEQCGSVHRSEAAAGLGAVGTYMVLWAGRRGEQLSNLLRKQGAVEGRAEMCPSKRLQGTAWCCGGAAAAVQIPRSGEEECELNVGGEEQPALGHASGGQDDRSGKEGS